MYLLAELLIVLIIPSFPCSDSQVPEVISSIRQVSKSALKEDSKPKQEADEAFYNSQKFEVLYCGKVNISLLKKVS